MHVNLSEKNSQNWIFHGQINIGNFLKNMLNSAYFEKNTNVYLGMNNPILGIFSQKFTCMYIFLYIEIKI